MRYFSVAILFCCTFMGVSCNKSGNTYSTANHTVGMIKTWTWSGTANGYLQGDTIESTPTKLDTLAWPKAFSRTISDTAFPVDDVDGFTVSVLGQWFRYKSTDSSASFQTVTFDTTLPGAAMSVLTYYYAADSMTYEYHAVTGYNAAANQYYQVNEFLHTVAD